MMARRLFQALKKAGRQRASAPIVYYAFSAIDKIEVCADDDLRISAAWKLTDYVGRLGVLNTLLGEIVARTARFLEHGLQFQLALEIGVLKAAEPVFDFRFGNLAGYEQSCSQ
jgi:hypothetical protein